MSIEMSDEVIRLSGPGRIEDAEALVALLQADPMRQVDLTQAGPLHAAVVQALLAFRPGIIGPAGDPFVDMWLTPLLAGAGEPPAVVADAAAVSERTRKLIDPCGPR